MKPILSPILVSVFAFQLQAQTSFNLSSSPAVGGGPYSVAAADVNGDGKADLVSANSLANSLSVLTNDGSGQFVVSGTYATGSQPLFVAAADVNGDGKVDFISANYGSNSLSVFTNNGGGRLGVTGTYAVGVGPSALTAADVNGDGKADLITANWGAPPGGSGNTLTVLTNNGSGGYLLACSPVVGSGATAVAAADVNDDGKMDLIGVNLLANSISVLTNDGTGGFVISGTYDVGSWPSSVVAEDANGDGKVDLICPIRNDNNLTVLTNDGSGGFSVEGAYATGNHPFFVVAADVTGDGRVDFISANSWGASLSVLTNDGSGKLMTGISPEVGNYPLSVAAVDVNGDGRPDLISANYDDNTLTVLTNATVFPFLPTSGYVAVTLGPVGAISAGGHWALDGGAWQNSGATISNVQAGVHIISFSSSAGWFTPNNQTIVVISGQTNTVNGMYGTITQHPSNQVVTNGGVAIFSVAVSGAGPFTYQWLFNSNNVITNGIIRTVAGNGTQGFSGDSGAATNASLNLAQGVAFDASGNMFIADSWNNRVRKVGANGLITTVAGGGAGSGPGIFGDGGPATNASLEMPTDLAFDTFGNLLIADQYHNRIRRVDTNGIITTVAGNTTASGWGSGSFSGNGGAAANAGLNNPGSITLDAAGNLFIADLLNVRVRKVDTNGIITTVAGNGISSFSGDGGPATNACISRGSGFALAVDGRGNLFISDCDNCRVRKVGTNGIITTMAGNGPYGYSGDGGAATNAAFWRTGGIALDAFGNLFISDCLNNRIRKVDPKGIITTVAGNGAAAFSGDGGAATNASLNYPAGVKCDASGNLFIPEYYNYRIREVELGGSPTLTLNQVTPGNAGNYQVIVSSPAGSVTSSVASLVVVTPSRTATATAIVAYNNFVVATTNLDGGFGYINAPLVRLIGGGGNGAGAYAVISNGIVISLAITNAGFGYTNTPLIVIEPPFAPSPVLEIVPMSCLTFSNLTLGESYQLQQASAWYWSNQPVSFTATNTVATQLVAGVCDPATFRLALNPVPTQAFATAIVDYGFMVGATITAGGSGYVTSPGVIITGGGGVGAGGIAHISGGAVTRIIITNAGIDYTGTPTIQIAPPPAVAISPTAAPVMRVDAATLAPFHNYQVQFTPDMSLGWHNWPYSSFTSAALTNSQYCYITNGTGFFRLDDLGLP